MQGKISEHEVFLNAPITEAIFDIRVELPKEVSLKELESFYLHIKERFPEKQERVSFRAGVEFSLKGSSVKTSSKSDGYLFKSTIEKKVVQIRLDGFTFNKLKPYKDWESFSSEAQELWNKYLQIAKPAKVVRIALRYINRIELPLPMKDFKEYILTTPEIAPELPQGLQGFFMQLIIPDTDIPNIGAIATITQTMESPTQDSKLPYIFDIDVFKQQHYEVAGTEMWNDFENLRVFKNAIFFKSITNKTKELFR